MIAWLRDGLGWRWRRLRRYAFLVRTFRNGPGLVSRYRRRQPCGRAVCWDGTEFRHPDDRGGLVETILEVWFDRVYTGGFYSPRVGDVVIDAGANVGLFAVWLARRYPGCRVIAFEPFDENYRLLCENIRSGGVATVEAHHAGLGGTSGRGRMAEGSTRSLDHRLEPADDGPGAVPVYSFADVLKTTDPARVALFKIDIEGSEFDLFASASAADLARVERYAIEYHEHLRPGTLELLRSRLEPTHAVTVHPAGHPGYGMLYALKRDAR
jgi:FkbM family methyltransferase